MTRALAGALLLLLLSACGEAVETAVKTKEASADAYLNAALQVQGHRYTARNAIHGQAMAAFIFCTQDANSRLTTEGFEAFRAAHQLCMKFATEMMPELFTIQLLEEIIEARERMKAKGQEYEEELDRLDELLPLDLG